MRDKLIEILRDLEKSDQHGPLQYITLDYKEEFQTEYSMENFIDFPDFKFIERKMEQKYSTHDITGMLTGMPYSKNGIFSELRRMELDGLINIGIQKGTRYAYSENNRGPDFDDEFGFNTESIVLTTKGKNEWRYFLYQATENPFAVVAVLISLGSLIVSFIALG